MSQTASFVRAEDFATRKVAGETILVPIRSGIANLECVFRLDEVGTAIWQTLEAPRTVDELVQELVRQFEVGEEEARRDVIEFLGSLKSSKLIVDGAKE